MSNDKKIIGQASQPEGKSLENVHNKANIIRYVIIGFGIIAIIVAIILFIIYR